MYMKKVTEIVQKVGSQYVGDDCIQVMAPYKNAITILNKDGVIYSHKEGVYPSVHEYVKDERRKQFPYSNIPTHYSRARLFGKMNYANQLLNFEEPYIRIGDGGIIENFAVKDNNQAFLITKILQANKTSKYMTYDELMNFVAKSSDNEQIYYVYQDGSLHPDYAPIYPSKKEIYADIKMKFIKIANDGADILSTGYNYDFGFPNYVFPNYIREAANYVDLDLIDFNIHIGNNSLLLVVRVNNGNITIQGVDVVFVRKDYFNVNIYDIPITKFTLEQLKSAPIIFVTREPKIPLRLNPGVSREDIQEAKQMVKSLRK